MFPRSSHDRLTERLSAGEPAATCPEPEFRLAAAVLARAALDWRALQGMPSLYTRELRQFFGGEWFGLLADCLGVDPGYLRRLIVEG